METVEKKEYKGLRFTELGKLKGLIPATWALSPTERLSGKGTFTIDLHKNSYMFQDEAVLSLWSREYPRLELRADNDGYFRLEIPIPLREFYVFLMELLPEIHARLNGIR